MNENISLADYPNRKRGSEPNYLLIEKAIDHLVVGGRHGEAIRSIEAAIDGFVAMADDRGEARARSKAAIIFRHLGQVDRSIREAEAALQYFRVNPEPAFASSASLELGQAYEMRGDLEAALRTYLGALRVLGEGARGETKEIRKMRAFIQDCAANVYSKTGRFEQARPLREAAIPVMEELKLAHDAVTGWTNLAQDQIQLKTIEAAARSLEQAHHWLDKMRLETAEGRSQQAKIETVFGLIVQAMLERGGYDRALGSAMIERARVAGRRAFHLYDGLGAPLQAANAALVLAGLELKYGSAEQAGELLRLADRRIPPEAAGADPNSRALRQRLDELRYSHFRAGIQGTSLEKEFPLGLSSRRGVRISMSDSPSVPAQSLRSQAFGLSDPRDRFPILWAEHAPEAAIGKMEDEKSADFLNLLGRRPKGGP